MRVIFKMSCRDVSISIDVPLKFAKLCKLSYTSWLTTTCRVVSFQNPVDCFDC